MNPNITFLEEKARICRLHCLDMAESAGYGLLGGSLSEIEILVALYFHVANISPENSTSENRDRVILSKAHSCEGLYAVLGERGFFDKSLFKTFGEWGSPLQGHVEKNLKIGMEYSGGSLGQGLSYAVGVALAGKRRGSNYKVYCIISDGESNEGQIWEAMMLAPQLELNNLIVIIDYNKRSALIEESLSLEPLKDKIKSFGWCTISIENGNNIEDVILALEKAVKLQSLVSFPVYIIANTVKGKGVPSWERDFIHKMSGEVLKKGIEEGRTLLGI